MFVVYGTKPVVILLCNLLILYLLGQNLLYLYLLYIRFHNKSEEHLNRNQYYKSPSYFINYMQTNLGKMFLVIYD